MLGPEFSEYVVIMLFTIHDPSVSAGGWCAKESKVISIGSGGGGGIASVAGDSQRALTSRCARATPMRLLYMCQVVSVYG